MVLMPIYLEYFLQKQNHELRNTKSNRTQLPSENRTKLIPARKSTLFQAEEFVLAKQTKSPTSKIKLPQKVSAFPFSLVRI